GAGAGGGGPGAGSASSSSAGSGGAAGGGTGENSLSGLLDASTKAALAHSAAMGLLPGVGGGANGGGGSGSGAGSGLAAPPPRPLSSVILAPVSLGLWESKKAAERVRQAARASARRVRT